ncbi:conserved hypothetical protein [Desulfotalea psychrophila LSv54]|uniref:Epoxyqueuosine reductase QueH n=1 Tax=Desulfotalea psychrophila (strain LSv54 / DSM 12343) TaxID=177439 RepID=Q6AQD6_DESPS|nr:conserved hypothetical protein [Desulfotalea psychrophila LSv54]
MNVTKLLLHCCCGPCAVYPISQLRKEGVQVTAYFYNHNIHPFKEFRRRLNTMEAYAKEIHLPFVAEREYELITFLRQAVFHEESRCRPCYLQRMRQTAEYAKEKGFDAFSTTLLYSKYQNHALIKRAGELLAEEFGLLFYYQDFREGWQAGIDESIEREMYRQPYCGCIYSEQERYDKRFRKTKERLPNDTNDSVGHHQPEQS